MVGVLNSEDGNDWYTLANLKRMFPMVRSIASRRSYLFYDHLNSLAVELMAVGCLEEAANASSRALASPYAAAYPEWQETGRDISLKMRRPSRSVVAVGSPLSDSARQEDEVRNGLPRHEGSDGLLPLARLGRRHRLLHNGNDGGISSSTTATAAMAATIPLLRRRRGRGSGRGGGRA